MNNKRPGVIPKPNKTSKVPTTRPVVPENPVLKGIQDNPSKGAIALGALAGSKVKTKKDDDHV